MGVSRYYQEILHPMDFGTMSLNLEKGLYTSWKEFSNHIELVLQNCRQFNPPLTYPRQCADAVEKVWKKEVGKIQEKKLNGMEKRGLQGLMTRLLKENELYVYLFILLASTNRLLVQGILFP